MICKNFLVFCGLSFNFVILSFKAQKFLILMRSSLSIFYYVSAFGIISTYRPCPPTTQPNSYVEILMPSVMVLVGGALGKCLRWSPHEWDYCPYKKGSREISSSFHQIRTQ